MTRLLKKFSRNEAGVSAVEFALILVPLLLLIFGIIEFGRAFQIRNEIERSLDIVARQFEIAECRGDRQTFFNNHLRSGALSPGIPNLDDLKITFSVLPDSGGAKPIKVQAEYNLDLLIPFFGFDTKLPVVRLISCPIDNGS